MREHSSQLEKEGELTEEELPDELLNQVEENCPIDRKHFAVSVSQPCARCREVVSLCPWMRCGCLWEKARQHNAPNSFVVLLLSLFRRVDDVLS